MVIYQQQQELDIHLRVGIHHQQVFGSICRIMVVKNLLDDFRRERFQVNTGSLASEERFTSVLKDSAHHGVDTASGYEMHAGLFVVFIPNFLYAADDAFTNVCKTLELIDDERHLRGTCINHQFPNDCRQAICLTMYVQSQNILHLSLEVNALQLLRFLSYKKIQVWLPLKCTHHQSSLSSAPTSHQHR